MASPLRAGVNNGLVLAGYDEDAKTMTYKGPFGAKYALNVEQCSTIFKFVHGDRVKFRKGKLQGQGGVIIGVHEDSLWIHDEEQGVASSIRNCSSFADLLDQHDPEVVPNSKAVRVPKEVNGPLNFRYTVNADQATLEGRYGLNAGSKIFLAGHKECTIVGEFLNVLWVISQRNPRVAIPLPGATNEETLFKLYGMADIDASTGRTSPRAPVTPGRARGTSRPFTFDGGAQTAECSVAFGNKVIVNTSKQALEPFNVKHGQRLTANKGLQEGKTFTVVGVNLGCLYVHFDEDRKCTALRNVQSASDLADLYGASTSAPRDAPASPAKKTVSIEAPSANNNNNKTPIRQPAAVSNNDASSPNRSAKLVQCWTAHGRQSFDTHRDAMQVFGVKFGDLVELRKGGDSGSRFTVIGVNQGILWVVPLGKQRATALRHCVDAKALAASFGLKVVGTSQEAQSLTELVSEPPQTPMNSPRSTPRGFGSPPSYRDSGSPRGNSSSPMLSNDPPPVVATKAAHPAVPMLNLQNRGGSFEADEGLSHSPPVNRAVDTNFTAGQMPATRQYLKAYALFRTMARTEADSPTAFHGYYKQDPTRLQAAMTLLPAFAQEWQSREWKNRQVSFGHATPDEMLEAMRKVPHLFQL